MKKQSFSERTDLILVKEVKSEYGTCRLLISNELTEEDKAKNKQKFIDTCYDIIRSSPEAYC